MAEPGPSTSHTHSRSTTSRKNRTPTSCDRCKTRKTKCVNPVPGPCEYCTYIKATCSVQRGARQRPYYHVTEEEYRCSMKILQHLLPSRELTVETLKSIAKELDNGNTVVDSLKTRGNVSTSQKELAAENEEVGELHDQLGCLMEDSLGEYRYVGACSEIAFNDAVCSMKGAPSPEKIIVPPRRCAFPPEKPGKPRLLQQVEDVEQPYLPPRDYCSYYVARFFEEVHCTYWFFAAEQFHSLLDDTYAEGGSQSSSSWLCSLYSIFALGAASIDSKNVLFDELVSEEAQKRPDMKTSHDYLMLAKALVPQIHEEADIDSIRALAILSLALETFGFRIMSYLYIGTSLRIAFSLGLQHDKSRASQSSMKKQQNRRLWCTLYILDQEIASRCGCPCVCNEAAMKIQIPLPSEKVLNPGTNTPLGSLSLSVSLSRLKRDIIQTIYPEDPSDLRTLSFSKVTGFITSLQEWQSTVPSHLKWGVPIAPTHRRAIAILQLNYWNSMMLLTQPFLLYHVLRGTNLSPTKRTWFERLGDICIDAAQSAIVIFKTMSKDGTLSSLVTSDSTCLLKVVMIMILALVKTNLQQYRLDVELCLSLLQGMEQVGFARTIVPELYARFEELGIMQDHGGSNAGSDASLHIAAFQFRPTVDKNSSFVDSMGNMQNLDADFGNSSWMDFDMNFPHMPDMSDSFQPNLGFLGEAYRDSGGRSFKPSA